MNLKTFSFIICCFIIYLAMCIICLVFSCIVLYVIFNKVIYEATILYGLMVASIWFLLSVNDMLTTFEGAWDKK